MAQTTFVWWFRRPSCKSYHLFAELHDAPCDRCAAPDDAPCDRCAAPDDAPCDLRAALGAVPYRTLLERRVLERGVLERLAVPEPQHLTSLAHWSARQSRPRRLIREGKRRLDARSFFHSCLISGDF